MKDLEPYGSSRAQAAIINIFPKINFQMVGTSLNQKGCRPNIPAKSEALIGHSSTGFTCNTSSVDERFVCRA